MPLDQIFLSEDFTTSAFASVSFSISSSTSKNAVKKGRLNRFSPLFIVTTATRSSISYSILAIL
ncbi:hypothetical protein ES708_20743 [subsurface metagenome]